MCFSFYDKKRFSSKKEQKTIDASEKVCVFNIALRLSLRFFWINLKKNSRAVTGSLGKAQYRERPFFFLDAVPLLSMSCLFFILDHPGFEIGRTKNERNA